MNGHKKLTQINSSSVDNSKTYRKDFSKIAKNLGEPTYLAGQDISPSPQGNMYTGDVDIHNGPSYGDIIHGANKYGGGDYDFTYRKSTRPSSQGAVVQHWSITGLRGDE